MARLRSVQALFQMEASGAGVNQVVRDFESGLLSDDAPGSVTKQIDPEYFRQLLDKALTNQQQIDSATSQALRADWPIDRIDPTIRAIFRAAGAELAMDSAPPRMVVDEFVEIAKAFCVETRAVGFVNGVLDNMARAMHPEAFRPK